MQGRENKSIKNLLSDASIDGPEDTEDHLLNVHFPGNIAKVGEGRENTYYGAFGGALGVIDYALAAKIQEVLASLGSHNAAGPDGLKPVVLQNLPDSCTDRLQLA